MQFSVSHDSSPWTRVDRRLNQFMLALLVPIMVLQPLRPGAPGLADPVLWLSALLFALCALQWWSIRRQWQAHWPRRAIPVLAVLLSTTSLWFNNPNAVLWLPVISFLVFMYLPLRTAQLIMAAAIVATLLILQLHWQVDLQDLVRVLLCSLFVFILQSLFFQANLGTATELTQTNQQLQAVLEDYGLLRQREMRRSREQLINALTQLSQYRDKETGQHIVRTQLFVRLLAQSLASQAAFAQSLGHEAIDLIVKAAPMHDLGKIGVPDDILRKPGRHTPEETMMMRAHASIGEATLLAAAHQDGGAELSLLRVAARIAGGHHENWDGSGYPRGLAGEAIALEARLMAVADVYDALTTSRHYKRRWTHDEARAEILGQRGRRFDPAVVDAFDRVHENMRRIAEQYQDPSESPACATS